MLCAMCHLVTECSMLVKLTLAVRLNLLNIANVGIDTFNMPHLQHKAEVQRKRNICGKICIEGRLQTQMGLKEM